MFVGRPPKTAVSTNRSKVRVPVASLTRRGQLPEQRPTTTNSTAASANSQRIISLQLSKKLCDCGDLSFVTGVISAASRQPTTSKQRQVRCSFSTATTVVSEWLETDTTTLILTDKRTYTQRTSDPPFAPSNGVILVSRFHLISSISMNSYLSARGNCSPIVGVRTGARPVFSHTTVAEQTNRSTNVSRRR